MRRFTPLLLVVAACTAGEPAASPPALTELASPSGAHAGEPFLLVDDRQQLHMTWIERAADSTHAVRHATFDGTAWSAPSTITQRKDLFVNWADFPALMRASDGRLVTHWLQRSGHVGKFSYDVRYAQSVDGGRTWSGNTLLHRDTTGKGEHGFVAMWPGDSLRIRAAWLDGRHMTGDHGADGGAMSLQSTVIEPDGTLGAETALDLRTCECCQVNAAMSGRGPVVVYRDRSDGDIRNIAVVRLSSDGWTAPQPVHDDGWHIEGCPVNGPAVAARGDTVVVAWFTGARDTARVNVAWSSDAGATFAAPIRVDGGNPVGRVDLELLPSGDAVVSWLERLVPEGAEVRARRVSRTAATPEHLVVARTAAARPSGFPKLVATTSDLIAAWTVPGDTARIHLARMPITKLP